MIRPDPRVPLALLKPATASLSRAADPGDDAAQRRAAEAGTPSGRGLAPGRPTCRWGR